MMLAGTFQRQMVHFGHGRRFRLAGSCAQEVQLAIVDFSRQGRGLRQAVQAKLSGRRAFFMDADRAGDV